MRYPKIDCHTHIVNREIYEQYLASPAGDNYALVMEFLPYMTREDLPDCSWDLCDGNEKLFLCPSVDIHQDIPAQLSAIEEKMQRVDKLVEKVAKLVSQATDLPAISMASRYGGATVRHFELVNAGPNSVILVVMLTNEDVVNKLIKLPVSITESDLKVLSALLNATMTGIGAEEFTEDLLERVMHSAGAAASLVPIIMEFTTETLTRQGSTNMAVAGQMRLLGQPEYRDVDKAQRLLTTLDEDMLANLPAVMQNANGTQVLVGPENVSRELKDTSVVVTKFDIGDGMQGMIGVVGPTRMDYAKVTARLSYFAESLSKLFAKPEQMQLPPADREEE